MNFFKRQAEQINAERSFVIDLKSNKYKFLQNFKIGGIIIIPMAIYLKLVLDIYSDIIGDKIVEHFAFENIYIYDVLLRVPRDDNLTLLIMVFQGKHNKYIYIYLFFFYFVKILTSNIHFQVREISK